MRSNKPLVALLLPAVRLPLIRISLAPLPEPKPRPPLPPPAPLNPPVLLEPPPVVEPTPGMRSIMSFALTEPY